MGRERPAHGRLQGRETQRGEVEAAFAKPIGSKRIRELAKTRREAVIVENEPKGPAWHYLEGKFGRDSGGVFCAFHRPMRDIGRVIIHSKYPMKDPWYPLYYPENQTWMKNWDDVVGELRRRHGDHADVAVIPESTITIPAELWK